MKFAAYIALVARVAFAFSATLGLVLGLLILLGNGAEGNIAVDIDISTADAIWFVLGTPLVVTTLFLILSPLSFFVHKLLSRLGVGVPTS
jgi:hypothetical protein